MNYYYTPNRVAFSFRFIFGQLTIAIDRVPIEENFQTSAFRKENSETSVRKFSDIHLSANAQNRNSFRLP